MRVQLRTSSFGTSRYQHGFSCMALLHKIVFLAMPQICHQVWKSSSRRLSTPEPLCRLLRHRVNADHCVHAQSRYGRGKSNDATTSKNSTVRTSQQNWKQINSYFSGKEHENSRDRRLDVAPRSNVKYVGGKLSLIVLRHVQNVESTMK